MSLVAYYPGDSFIHKLDPRVKILLLFFLTLVILVSVNYWVIGTLFVFILVLWYIAKLPFNAMLSYFKFLAGISVFIIITQGLFYGGERALVDPLIPEFVPLLGGSGRITLEGILFGVLVSLRMIALVCLTPIVIMTTPVHLLALGLIKLGLPYRIAYMATTALNMIPTLQREIKIIIDAQKLRGLSVFEQGSLLAKMKAYPALVVPLVIGAMRKAQLIGVAMDSRAFGASPSRTYLEDIEMTRMDWVSLGMGCTCIVILFCWSIIF